MPPASHPGPCTSVLPLPFAVATSVADCRDERIIHEVGAINKLHYNFAHIDRLWTALKIYGKNNCFYCLGTANRELPFNGENNRFYRLGTAHCELPPEGSSFLIVLVAEEIAWIFLSEKIIVSIVSQSTA